LKKPQAKKKIDRIINCRGKIGAVIFSLKRTFCYRPTQNNIDEIPKKYKK
jgi:hypothetical protein